jgi:hypothetical protein
VQGEPRKLCTFNLPLPKVCQLFIHDNLVLSKKGVKLLRGGDMVYVAICVLAEER